MPKDTNDGVDYSSPGKHIPFEPYESMKTALVPLPDGFAVAIQFGKYTHFLSPADYAKLGENLMHDALEKLKQLSKLVDTGDQKKPN